MVASETRGPQFESSHRQNSLNICILTTVLKSKKNKEKEGRNGQFFEEF